MRFGGRTPVVAILVLAAALPVFAQRLQRTIFVKVVDSSGAPVTGLTAADFEVKEGDTSRTIAYAGPATSPMRVVLLVDTGSNMAPFQAQLKDSLNAFIDAIPEPHEIAIISMGRQIRTRQAPTADRAKLHDAAGKTTIDGGGIMFFDALREAESRFMKKDGTRWPIYVMLLTDGNEASTPIQDKEFQALANDMFARGTTLNAITFEKIGPTPITGITANLVKSSGGALDNVKVPATLPERARAMAQTIAAQIKNSEGSYLLEYASDASYHGSVEAGATRPGVKSTMSMRR
jgi:hypothetical protein